MSEMPDPSIQISIDMKKYRVRIHRESLRLIGDPKYIQLLVNIGSRLVAIRAVDAEPNDLQAYKVNQERMASDFSFEIYSRPFIGKLGLEFKCFDAGCCYRLSGRAIPSERIAVFSVDSAQKLEQ